MFGPERFAASGPFYVAGKCGMRIARLACALDAPCIWRGRASGGVARAPRIWRGRAAHVAGAPPRLAGCLERAADCLFRNLCGAYERRVAPCGREPFACQVDQHVAHHDERVGESGAGSLIE